MLHRWGSRSYRVTNMHHYMIYKCVTTTCYMRLLGSP